MMLWVCTYWLVFVDMTYILVCMSTISCNNPDDRQWAGI